MSLRRFLFTCVTTLSPFVLLLSATQLAHASPRASAPYSISGHVSAIASPQAFAASGGAQFFDVSHVPLRIPQPTYYVVQAQAVNGNYEYAYDLVVAHGSVVGVIELAVNPTTQRELLEIGVPTADSIATANATQPNGGQSATQTIAGLARQAHGKSISPNSSTSGSYRTVWNDLGIREVNEVKDYINFTYDGIYVNSFNGSDYRWWGNGWSEDSHSIGSYYNSNYTTGTVWTHDHFGSYAYCWPSYNEIYYSNNNVVGYGSGAVGGHVSTSADGACSGMLSYWSQVSGGA